MAWTRIDDKFLMNPKIQSAGVYGMALYLSGLIYCNTNLTDGHIPDVMLPVLCGLAYQTQSKRVADALVELNLWERVPGGYIVHDFLTFNKSRNQIESLNKQRAVNGTKHKLNASGTGTETGTGTGTGTGCKPVPIIPNTLIPLKELTSTTTGSARESEFGTVVKAYESEIGILTPAVADGLKLAMSEYPVAWFEPAFREAAHNNKRSWKYALAILKRWKADGFQVDSRPKTNGNGYRRNGNGSRKPDMGDYVVDRSNEIVVVDDGTEVEGELQF